MWVLAVVLSSACGGRAEESADERAANEILEFCAEASELDCLPRKSPERCAEELSAERLEAYDEECGEAFDDFLACRHSYGDECRGDVRAIADDCRSDSVAYGECRNL